ncbi:MAG TPA: hypothetical protein DCK95_02985 [Anaerolineaceae bacterium]|nr:hypothetical protein [Anaerolineaceae bacterium]
MNLTAFLKGLLEANTKTAILIRTIFLIIIISFFWVYIYITPYLKPIQSDFKINNDFLLDGLIGWFSLLIYTLIVSTDKLADINSKSKYAKAFQRYWPSRYISEHFDIDINSANYIWFEKNFNTWEKSDSSRNSQYKRTFERGYQCRLVYYLIIVLSLFIIFSAIQLIIEFIVMKQFLLIDNYLWKCIFLGIALVSYLTVKGSNKIKEDKKSGVWKKYDEINQLHIDWIEENSELIENQIKKIKKDATK